MSMNSETCRGKTKAGTPCQLPAGDGGNCHHHDPEAEAARKLAAEQARAAAEEQWKKGERLRELVDRFMTVAQRMGWKVELPNMDREGWTHARLNIRRYVGKASLSTETVKDSLK